MNWSNKLSVQFFPSVFKTDLQYEINILPPSALSITTLLSMHLVSMVTWFYGVCA